MADDVNARDWRVCAFELPSENGVYWRHALRSDRFDILRNDAAAGKYLLLEMPPRSVTRPQEYGVLDVAFRSLRSLMVARARIPLQFEGDGVSFVLGAGEARIVDAASDVYHAHPRTVFVDYQKRDSPSIGSLFKQVVLDDEPLDDSVVRFFDAMVGRPQC